MNKSTVSFQVLPLGIVLDHIREYIAVVHNTEERLMSDDFSTYVQSEREKLTQRRGKALDEMKRWKGVLEDLDKEFAAINAYEAAKTGKAIGRVGSAAPRARRSGQREAIMRMLRTTPSGMTRGELLAACGVKGDKAGEGSISNALSALQRSGKVMRQDGGRWAVVATEEMRQAAE
jgi:hypothetical protein